ncbi:arginine N-succinyltransferase [Deferrisoma palaeochoriense]
MMVLRPVRVDDLEAVVGLVGASGYGLTSLPKDPDLLADRVRDGAEAFGREIRKPGGESYLFVLEDLETGAIAGTSGIVAKVGGFEPFYTYRLETHELVSEVLGIRREIRCLHLVREHSGPCEIGSLYLSPAYRRHGNGRMLSLGRFLYMACQPHRFERVVIAEMRGVVDPAGRCPFWEAIGRHFFGIDFPKADYLSVRDKRIISELMPTHPIYVPLLPREAQEVIGRVHPETEPALALLRQEGFEPLGFVDIFDGGPVVGCDRPAIRTVRETRVVPAAPAARPADGVPHLVAPHPTGVPIVSVPLPAGAAEAPLDGEARAVLGVSPGDPVACAPLRPGGTA